MAQPGHDSRRHMDRHVSVASSLPSSVLTQLRVVHPQMVRQTPLRKHQVCMILCNLLSYLHSVLVGG
jgi:hypothetical protein